jgi:RNA polymerase sigma-70 factor, ECF subfamily
MPTPMTALIFPTPAGDIEPSMAADVADRRDASGVVIGYRRDRATAATLRGRTGLSQTDEPGDRQRIRADQDLMAAIASGDEAAFARLIGEQSPPLLRFARTLLTAGTAEAEEVVQETFLRLWQQAETWQPNGRVSTWLHQVAYRLCIDNLRRRRRSVPLDIADTEDIADEAPRPDQRLIRIDDVRAVRAAIARLPERQRAALVLFHFQEMSQADAAAVMGVGESAFESLLARARRRLRIHLSVDDNGEGGTP